MKKEDCFYLGKIVKKYSFKGELILRLDTDEPEIYENLNAVFIDMGKTLVPYFIENSLVQNSIQIECPLGRLWCKIFLPKNIASQLPERADS